MLIGPLPQLTTAAIETIRALLHRMPMHLAPEPPRSWLAADPIWLGSALENPDLLSMHRVSRRVNNARNDVSDCVAALLVPQNSASRNARAAPGIETCCFRYACGSRRAASVWTPSVRPKFQRDQSLGGPASKYRSVLATYIANTHLHRWRTTVIYGLSSMDSRERFRRSRSPFPGLK